MKCTALHTTVWADLTIRKLSKAKTNTKHTPYDCLYVKFKARQDNMEVAKVRRSITFGEDRVQGCE